MDLRKTFCVKCKGDTNNVNSFVVQHVKARQMSGVSEFQSFQK